MGIFTRGKSIVTGKCTVTVSYILKARLGLMVISRIINSMVVGLSTTSLTYLYQ
jgi:hypothetical protein